MDRDRRMTLLSRHADKRRAALVHSAEERRSIPIITPAEGVSEALIRQLVETFYERVIRDPDLGPIFRRALSGRWSDRSRSP